MSKIKIERKSSAPAAPFVTGECLSAWIDHRDATFGQMSGELYELLRDAFAAGWTAKRESVIKQRTEARELDEKRARLKANAEANWKAETDTPLTPVNWTVYVNRRDGKGTRVFNELHDLSDAVEAFHKAERMGLEGVTLKDKNGKVYVAG